MRAILLLSLMALCSCSITHPNLLGYATNNHCLADCHSTNTVTVTIEGSTICRNPER